ncbi:MAG TPA: nucleoside hydrolase [Thermomicrobiales bacterium]|nr:nucleoside hydrolase [Thermomicrobiales bacterium]
MVDTRVPVILDTDIGTDVDDTLALAVLLGSPEIDLLGVTTVYGDVALRARMARKLLALRGRDNVTVYEGIAEPLMRNRPVYWPGHEGVGLLEAGDDARFGQSPDQHAVDYLIESVMARPGKVHLLAVGPLTNVAAALIREPKLASNLAHLTIMGGVIATWTGVRGAAEHNIQCDPEAARVVFASGAPISLVPLDVTLKVDITQEGVEAIQAVGTPFHEAVADQVARYPGFQEREGRTSLHDPLAAAAVLQPDLLQWHDLVVDIELAGRLTTGMTVARQPGLETPSTARVAMDVDVDAAEQFITDRICGNS